MEAVQHSAFDSEIFGCRYLRVIEPDPVQVALALRAQPPEAPLIIDAKLPATQADRIAALQDLGFRRAATMIELRRAPAPQPDDEGVRVALALTDPELDAHAAQFTCQRFFQDPRIPRPLAQRLMRTWIANSLAGRRKTVAIGRNFCTYAPGPDSLVIDLLSCLDRGRGMAGQLLGAVVGVAYRAHASTVHVTTEAENTPALKAYVRAGFVPHSAAVALHYVRLGG